MGGFGSGRRRTATVGYVDSAIAVDIDVINRAGALCSWNAASVAVVTYRLPGIGVITILIRGRRAVFLTPVSNGMGPVGCCVAITWQPCHFGGSRPFWRCPATDNGVPCQRTVARLYAHGEAFLCRRCARLSYVSQHETPMERAATRANRIRTRLGGTPTPTPFRGDFVPSRPEQMKRPTCERQLMQLRLAEAAAGRWYGKAISDVQRPGRRNAPGTSAATPVAATAPTPLANDPSPAGPLNDRDIEALELAESALYRLALNPRARGSTSAIIFFLKTHRPEVYGDRYPVRWNDRSTDPPSVTVTWFSDADVASRFGPSVHGVLAGL